MSGVALGGHPIFFSLLFSFKHDCVLSYVYCIRDDDLNGMIPLMSVVALGGHPKFFSILLSFKHDCVLPIGFFYLR